MWSKNCLITVSIYGKGVVVLKELIFNSFLWGEGVCERTGSTLEEGCGGLEETDF